MVASPGAGAVIRIVHRKKAAAVHPRSGKEGQRIAGIYEDGIIPPLPEQKSYRYGEKKNAILSANGANPVWFTDTYH